MKFDYNKFDNDFDVTWSSPPCTEYIIAKQTGTRKIDEANETVKKAIDIINYFDPNVFVENPPDRTFEGARVYEKLRFLMLDGMAYRKRTRLWTNIKTWTPKPLCKKNCVQMEGNRHRETAQRAPSNRKETWPENLKTIHCLIRRNYT